MLNYIMIVNDGGELKTISQEELEDGHKQLSSDLDQRINKVLDEKAIAAGEYNPEED